MPIVYLGDLIAFDTEVDMNHSGRVSRCGPFSRLHKQEFFSAAGSSALLVEFDTCAQRSRCLCNETLWA